MSVFCEFFWVQKIEKNLTSAFSKNKGNLLFVDGQWLAVLPWQRYLAQHLVSKYLPSWLIFHHANFGHPEVRSFQITFTNTCVLENCVRPP